MANCWPPGWILPPIAKANTVIATVTTTALNTGIAISAKRCQKYFDELTNTIFQGHHQPLKIWVVCLYLMGLNLSNSQIAKELGLTENDSHAMTSLLREGVYEKRPQEVLEGEVEFDELYIIAGHKGHPEAVKKRAAKDADDD